MIDKKEIIRRLTLHEGLRLKPYRCCAGKLTIGVGRNLIDNPLSKTEKQYLCRDNLKDGITAAEAAYLLMNDINSHWAECRKHIACFSALDHERQYALLDMCFNLGIRGLLKFRKMLEALSIGDYRGAAKECLQSKYAKDTGIRAVRISRLLENGIWRENVKI